MQQPGIAVVVIGVIAIMLCLNNTAVRLKVEENQLVMVFAEIGVLVDGLEGA
jgi:hypothetical protein